MIDDLIFRLRVVSRLAKAAADLGTYVGRPVLMPRATANACGISADPGMHVTQMYSLESFPVTPLQNVIAVRPIKWGVLGPDNALVLFIECPEMLARFHEMTLAGATPTYPEYRPHITFFYYGPDAKLTPEDIPSTVPDVEILLGPEEVATLDAPIFEKIDPFHDEKGRFSEAPATSKALEALARAPSVKFGFEPDWASERPGAVRIGNGKYSPLTGEPNSVATKQKVTQEGKVSETIAYDKKGNAVGKFSRLLEGPSAGAFKIVVDPKAQRQGIGTRLIDAAVKDGFDPIKSIPANRFTPEGRALLESWIRRAHPMKKMDPYHDDKGRFAEGPTVMSPSELTVYHGSPVRGFHEFDPAKINPHDPDAPYNGFWFSSSYEDAKRSGDHPWGRPSPPGGGETRAFKLDLKNPATKAEAYKVAREVDLARSAEYKATQVIPDKTLQTATREELLRRGYDGIIHEPHVIPNRAVFDRDGRVPYGKNSYELVKENNGYGEEVALYQRGDHVTGYTDFDDAVDQLKHGTYVVLDPKAIKLIQ